MALSAITLIVNTTFFIASVLLCIGASKGIASLYYLKVILLLNKRYHQIALHHYMIDIYLIEKAKLLVPWMILNVVSFIWYLISFITSIADQGPESKTLIEWISIMVYFGLSVYFENVVVSLYRIFKS